MKVRLHNTLTGKVQSLSPSTPGEVRLYSCGPTVYTYAHVGNLRTYIFSDVLRRALRSAGFRVRHVMSVTDVGHLQSDADEGEHKMVLVANREARSPWQIARFYEDRFFEDCDRLHIFRPDVVCRATEHVEEMIRFVECLIDRGYAPGEYGVDEGHKAILLRRLPHGFPACARDCYIDPPVHS